MFLWFGSEHLMACRYRTAPSGEGQQQRKHTTPMCHGAANPGQLLIVASPIRPLDCCWSQLPQVPPPLLLLVLLLLLLLLLLFLCCCCFGARTRTMIVFGVCIRVPGLTHGIEAQRDCIPTQI
jgi:hypothetical protein